MAHKAAKREFDLVAFDKWYDGTPRWTYTPRNIANAKAKAKREGYTNFFVAWKEDGQISPTMDIVRYIYDEDNSKWIYS